MRRAMVVLVGMLMALIQSFAQTPHETGLNFLSPEEYKKVPVAELPVAGLLPARANLEWLLPAVGNQGSKPSCFAWAATYNKAYRIFDASGRKGRPDDYLQSPAFVFSAMTGDQCNRGGYLASTFAFLTNVGSVSWADLPYKEDQCRDWHDYISKAGNRSTRTWRLGDADILSEIKDHIAGGDPVVAGILACDDFQYPDNGMITKVNDGRGCGGHAVLLVGYDDDLRAVRILNSWGRDWGTGGKAWMSYGVLSQRLHEAYVDYGPDLNPSGSNFLSQKAAVDPSSLGVVPVVSPEVLLQSLRVSVDSRVWQVFLAHLWKLSLAHLWQIASSVGWRCAVLRAGA